MYELFACSLSPSLISKEFLACTIQENIFYLRATLDSLEHLQPSPHNSVQ
jgi:hypothetical protein